MSKPGEPVDHSRGIIASLFSPPPGTNAQPSETFIAYVQTFEEQPGNPQRKARFLIISAGRDGRLKLHKAKMNNNGSFSIGKTWWLEELRSVEVSKVSGLLDIENNGIGPDESEFNEFKTWRGLPVEATSRCFEPLEFVLIINGKIYRYETELPSSQQAAFLVTAVRCWRRYMNGRGAPELILVGFSVDSPTPPASARDPSRSRPTTAQSSHSTSSVPLQPPLTTSRSNELREMPRPGSAGAHSAYSSRSAVPMSSGLNQSQSSTSRERSSNASQQSQVRPSIGGVPPQLSTASSSSFGRSESPAPVPGPRKGSSNQPYVENGGQTIRSDSPSNPQSYASAAPSGRVRGGSGPTQINQAPSHQSAVSMAQMPSGSRNLGTAAGNGPYGPALGGVAGAPGQAGLGLSMGRSKSSVSSEAGGAHAQRNGSGSGRETEPRKAGFNVDGGDAGVGPMSKRTPLSAADSGEIRTKGTSISKEITLSKTATVSETRSVPPSAIKSSPAEDQMDNDTVLSNVEEMLEGFEWRGAGGGGNSGSGAGSGTMVSNTQGKADEVEKRLVGELKALEAASIHAIMESDDRVIFVIKHLDDALAELDRMDSIIGLYKTQLNLMTDDIAHIEGQNRGLQVQTSNQRSLLTELDNLMETIHIPEADLLALTQESMENPKSVERLERAAVSLYKALLSTRDTAVGDMAAASERVEEYRTKAAQFCKRVFDFLSIMFKFQVDQILNPKDKESKDKKDKEFKPHRALPSHLGMEDFLGRYCGLMLFVKEIDQARYEQICSAYFVSMSDLHRSEIQGFMSTLRGQIRKASDEELDASLNPKESPTMRQQSIRRAGTLVRSPLESGRSKNTDGNLVGSEAFQLVLSQITPHITQEQQFISDFLHINPLETSITFADYMLLETYFRRGAMSFLNMQQGKLKDIRSAMDSIFGFLDAELRDWLDGVLMKDSIQIVGVLAALDRAILDNEQERNEWLARTLQKQYQKSMNALDRTCKEQIRGIEQTKLTLKKRKGVAPFVRVFPFFVARVESQLEGADSFRIRSHVNSNYERIVSTMLECLQQMAKMSGEGQGAGEDKDQLNYHVVMIENMHHIDAAISKRARDVSALSAFVTQAKDKYNENLNLYIKLILRRPIARTMDFFAGIEQLLRTTPPNEVSLHSQYTKNSAKRTLSDMRAKDIRKAIDGLYKRVDKHFSDASSASAEHVEVLKSVWRACEDEMIRLTKNWKGLIDKCYPDDKVALDFGLDEVHDFFVKAQNS